MSQATPPDVPVSAAPPNALELFGQLRKRFLGDGVGAAFAQGALQSTVLTVVGSGVSMAAQVLVARAVGHDAYGAYQYTIALMNAVLLFATLELDNIGVRFVGSYAATARWGLLKGFLRDSRRAVWIASLTCGTVGAIIVEVARGWFAAKHPMLPAAVLAGCVLLPVTALLLLHGSILQGFQRYAPAQFAPNVARPLLLGLLMLAGYLGLHQRMMAWVPVAANVAGSAIALVFAVVATRRATPPEVRSARAEYDRRDWIRTTRPLLLVSAAQLIISQQADLIVVGTIIAPSETATYGAASQLTAPLAIIVNAVTFVAQAMIADLFARSDRGALQSLVRAVSRANALVTFPIVAILVVFGKPLLGLYGPAFVAGYPVLVILALSQLVGALVGGLAGYMLTMTRYQREAAWIIGASALVNLGLTLILTPRYGLLGTASATLIAATFRSIVLSVFIQRVMGLRVPAL